MSALLPAAALAVLVVLALTALAALAPAHAAEVEGIGVDDAVQLDGAWLELNGAGMRTVYIVKTYVAALYVP
ncbi:MAG TPA: chalcone isomerase family protein, partial [Burkholderiaceae bacterium]|nr:chalcone isomerase family protein [Burkholderiaceae bacterium]